MSKSKIEIENFIAETQKQLAKIANKHGLKLPKFSSFEIDGAIFLNVTAFNENPDKIYAKWYQRECDEIGLERELLNKKFFSKEISSYISIIGIDPDGGERCIRVRDESGVDYHMHPSEIKRLVSL